VDTTDEVIRLQLPADLPSCFALAELRQSARPGAAAMRRDLARLLREARGRGWRVERTARSHWRLRHPSGDVVVASGTPSCPRSLRNVAADLRRVERRAGA
jgi:predicted RNA binding protein YcfA (HicA-like mRNA interferase family)